MRKIFFIIIVYACVIGLKPVLSQTIDVSFYMASFCNSQQKSYIETYMKINTNTLSYVAVEEEQLQTTAEITLIFKNISEVKEFRKYKIVGPRYNHTPIKTTYLKDMQRIFIPQGIYNFTLIVSDPNAPDSISDYVYSDIITVDFPKNTIALSDIQLLKSHLPSEEHNLYVKNGYKFIPYISKLYNDNEKYIRFYIELYNASKEFGALENFWFETYIQATNTEKPIKKYISKSQQKALNNNKWLHKINISDLPKGYYYLTVNVMNKDKKIILTKQKFFERKSIYKQKFKKTTNYNNKNIKGTFVEQLNLDSLIFFVDAIYPICDSNELYFIKNNLQKQSVSQMRKFFYTFWTERNKKEPKQMWENYKTRIHKAMQLFADEGKLAIKTDRARVYLQYGQPRTVSNPLKNDTIQKYELWNYYKIANMTNRKFLFHKDTTNKNYRLIETNMQGEQIK